MGERVDLAEAAERVAAVRARGGRIVLANGCFDPLHVGHVRYLEGARAEGDLLVVAVNDDASVRRLKGAGRPILSEDERAEIVAALEAVDLVVVFGDDDVGAILEALRPDVHCKGTDYTEASVPEREVTRRLGGATRIVGDRKDHSSRDLIGRVLERFGRGRAGRAGEEPVS